MRKLVIGLALASTAFATPALARDGAWYLELDFGPGILEDSDFDIGALKNNATLDSDYGFDGGATVGYDFGPFRLETEASYRKFRHDNFSLVSPAGSINNPRGNANSLTFFVNGLLDFGPDNGIQGFVGGGAGIGRASYRVSSLLDDSDTGFAWQALAGVRAPITDNIDVGIKYRFLNIDNVDLVASNGAPVSTRWRSHSAMGTLSFNFGGAEEVLPPPPPPPPPAPVEPTPPPPPVVECNKGPYIVFFDWDKSDITPEAGTILDSAVTAYGNCANVPIMLAGYTDRSGSARYNQGLSERRNASVRSYLVGRGIPDGSISSQGFGETNNRVPTADGVRELQNRRVEITYGPGSGF